MDGVLLAVVDFLCPGVALFVTRVSRGRTIREVLLAMVVGAVPVSGVYGVLESYSVHSFISGMVDVPQC
jgi:BCCT family betaine/carnitine transporter